MDITKPNDIFVATLNNPSATTSDLMTLNLNPENTGLLPKDSYKKSKYVSDRFTTEDGKFDEASFDNFYKQAATHYVQMSDERFLKDLETVEYSPFDLTRPKDSKTFGVEVEYKKEFNPYKRWYGKTGLYSVEESEFSQRELAQQGKYFDFTTGEWSEKSVSDLNIFQKFFGDTLVYAQWDEDGIHTDPETNRIVEHKKGDWKISDDGNFYLETLGKREIYGKQVVNPTDLLTVDGSFANQFDIFDSDSKEKSIAKIALKTAVEIAPFLIPGFNVAGTAIKVGQIYGGLRAAIGMASSLPTFYKSFESMLLGESVSPLNKTITGLEGYFAKFNQSSISDASQGTMLNIEQLSDIVSSVFSQIYEQRAMASLSKVFYGGDKVSKQIASKYGEAIQKIQREALEGVSKGKLDFEDVQRISAMAAQKVPELKALMDKQSQLSKALSLSYMALTSTSDIYGEALEGGYDRRTAGFAALLTAAGQYGIMMNNRMGDWFLDKTTGYTVETNKALMRKGIDPYLDKIQKVFATGTSEEVKRKGLSKIFSEFKDGLEDLLFSPSELIENLWKKALIEGVEEVTEQVMEDTTKGMIDVMSSLGLTKKQGSFGGWNNVFSREGLETYLASFVGGLLGGAMFEFEKSHLPKLLDPNNKVIQEDTKKSLYDLIANGYETDIINYLNKQRKKLGNSYISPLAPDGSVSEATDSNRSQADLIVDTAIGIVKRISGVFDAYDLKKTDDEIVKRAILDDTVIKKLEENRKDGNPIGIEGLILEEYQVYRDKINDIGLQIKAGEEKGEDMTGLKEELKIYVKKRNDIVEGKNAGVYYDKMMMLLNPWIAAPFLTMDKASYTKHTYNMNYNDLSQNGVGITKSRIDSEWSSMIEGKELLKHLDTITNAYLEWEKALNKPIAEYSSTGYSSERAEVYKKVLDLEATMKVFNTSDDPSQKQASIEKFIEINNYFKSLGLKTILPWDVLKTGIADDIINEKLLKKVTYELDSEGKYVPVESEYTAEELKDKNLRGMIDLIFQNFPTNPLDIDLGITNFNAIQNDRVQSNINRIQELSLKGNLTEEESEELDNLTETLKSVPRIHSLQNTTAIQSVVADFHAKAVDLKNAFNEKSGRSLEDLDKDLEDLSSTEDNKDLLTDMIGMYEVSKDGDLVINTSATQFISKLVGSGALAKTFSLLRSSLDTSQIEEFQKRLIELQNSPTESIEESSLKLIQDYSEIFKRAAEEFTNLYNISKNEDLKILSQSLKKLKEDEASTIEKAKPEFFKLKNYTLEFLLNFLNTGNVDEEIWSEVSRMIEDQKKEILLKVFDDKSDNFDIVREVDNNKELLTLLSGYDEDSLGFGEDPTVFENEPEIVKALPEEFWKLLKNKNIEVIDEALQHLQNIQANLKNYTKELEQIKRFEELSKKVTLKKNTLYDFIRNFSLTLNSNTKVSKILDILENEDKNLMQSSSVNNYITDGSREQDVIQVLGVLNIVKSVVNAMSTTEINYSDPIGFIYSRKEFAKRNGIDSEVKNLETINSDIASLMNNDLDKMINRISFLKQLAENNSGRSVVEHEIIRKSMNQIFLDNWQQIVKNLPISVIPKDKFNDIYNSNLDAEEKLLKIEDLFYESNKNNKEQALNHILTQFSNIDPSKVSKLDRDVSAAKITSWDTVLYFASTLVVKASDWATLNLRSLDSFDKAPFYVQELVARIVRASTIDPMLFSGILSKFYNSDNENADFITFVLGGAGTGKTTAVFGLNLDHFRMTNDKSILRVVAPTELQTNNLDTAIKGSVGEEKLDIVKASKQQLYDQLGVGKLVQEVLNELSDIENSRTKEQLLDNVVVAGKTNKYVWRSNEGKIGVHIPDSEFLGINYDSLPNLILIDEITHFSFAEIHILNEISKRSYISNKSNFVKIIAAGDPNQLGYFIDYDGRKFNYNVTAVNGIFAPRLFASIRALNNQKRANTDFLTGIVETISDIYSKENNRVKANSIAQDYISKENYTLEWFQDENNLNGDLIVDSVLKSHIAPIANAIKTNPERTLGILTDDGVISSDIKILLEELHIPEENIKIFTPKNIQGSEVDYFIFNVKAVDNFDTIRDKFKSFYTFTSRSKRGSIIIDNVIDGKSYLKEELSISNAKKSLGSQEYEPVTPEVIKKAKEARKEKLLKLLNGVTELSKEGNFKWKTGDVSKATSDSQITEDSLEEIQFPQENELLSNSAKVITPTQDLETDFAKKDNSISAKDFKLILYSFYKNTNAIIKTTKDKVTITSPDNALKSDLNIGNIVFTKDEFYNLERQWLSLKNHLLNKFISENSNKFTIKSTNYDFFLGKAFNESVAFHNVKDLNVEIVITASEYNDVLNAPYNKSLDNKDKHLKNKDPFINIAAKVNYSGKIHYITLASFPSENTLKTKGMKKVIEGEREALSIKLVNAFTRIKNEISTGPKVYKLNSDVTFLTGVRLLKGEKGSADEVPRVKLSEISEKFKDVTVSEIRLYPNNFNDFKDLWTSNYFEHDGGTLTNEVLLKEFERHKNKPYVRVTFGDFKGNNQGKLVSVYGATRTLNDIKKEVSVLLKEIAQIASDKKAKKEKVTTSDFEHINVMADMMTNKSNVLNLLIKWGKTKTSHGESVIDLLTKEHSSTLKIFSKDKFSLIDVITRFRESSEDSSFNPTRQLMSIIEVIKKEIAKNPTAEDSVIKKNLLSGPDRSLFLKKWNDGFHNLFAYEDIIKSKTDVDFSNALYKFFNGVLKTDSGEYAEIEDLFTDRDVFVKLAETARTLIDSVPKEFKFYYSVPIISEGGTLKVNPLVSGKSGFNDKDIFSKLLIRVILESPNLLMDPTSFIDLKEITETEEDIEEEEETSENDEVEEEVDDENKLSYIFNMQDLKEFVSQNLKYSTAQSRDNESQKLIIESYLDIFSEIEKIIESHKDNLTENVTTVLNGNSLSSFVISKIENSQKIDKDNYLEFDNLFSIFSEIENELGLQEIGSINADFFVKLIDTTETELELIKRLGKDWILYKRNIINHYKNIC